MEINMKETFLIIKKMEMEVFYGQLDKIIQDNGLMIKYRVKEF